MNKGELGTQSFTKNSIIWEFFPAGGAGGPFPHPYFDCAAQLCGLTLRAREKMVKSIRHFPNIVPFSLRTALHILGKYVTS